MGTPLVAAGAVCGTLLSATAVSNTISTVYRTLPCNAGHCRLLYRKSRMSMYMALRLVQCCRHGPRPRRFEKGAVRLCGEWRRC
jgi:hypothetical protein